MPRTVGYVPTVCLSNVSDLFRQPPELPTRRPEHADAQRELIRDWLERWHWCALPGAGTFSGWHPLPADELRARACDAPLLNGEGSWVENATWSPQACAADGRRLALTRATLLRCVAGRVVLFEGDSFTRQLFLRLIWWLRGSPTIIEHYFHRDAAYEFDENGDRFEIISEEFKKSPADWRPHRAVSFDEKLSSLNERLESVLKAHPRRKGANFLFRLYGRGELYSKFADSPRLVAGIVGRFTQFEVRSRNTTASLSLDVMNGFKQTLPLSRMKRYAAQGRWPRNSMRVGRWPPLKADGTVEDVHLQCTFGPMYPADVSGWKWPANGDCSDVLGLNAVTTLMSRACAMHEADRKQHTSSGKTYQVTRRDAP